MVSSQNVNWEGWVRNIKKNEYVKCAWLPHPTFLTDEDWRPHFWPALLCDHLENNLRTSESSPILSSWKVRKLQPSDRYPGWIEFLSMHHFIRMMSQQMTTFITSCKGPNRWDHLRGLHGVPLGDHEGDDGGQAAVGVHLLRRQPRRGHQPRGTHQGHLSVGLKKKWASAFVNYICLKLPTKIVAP